MGGAVEVVRIAHERDALAALPAGKLSHPKAIAVVEHQALGVFIGEAPDLRFVRPPIAFAEHRVRKV